MRLLDVNVLIAIADSGHPFHEIATAWLRARIQDGWATCPLTENALLRILGAASYPGSPGPPSAVRRILNQLRNAKGFEFWADDVSLADPSLFPSLAGLSAKHLTDIYLLGLAARRNGRFSTFDSRIHGDIVSSGAAAIEIIPTA